VAVLHTDASVLPRRKKAWAAWNYQRTAGALNGENGPRVCLHYLLNMLQPLPFSQPVVVSLNPAQELDPALVHGRFDYAHPVFDLAATEAQKRLPAIQGGRHTYFCGAWTGYGFHEDGLKSGLAVADALKPLLAQGA
jgi:predicted NAD/FAD-binding protein